MFFLWIVGKYINTGGFKTRSENESFFFFAKSPDRTYTWSRIKEAIASWPKLFCPTYSEGKRSKQKRKFRHCLGLLPGRDVTTHHFLCVYFQPRTTLQTKKKHITHGLRTPGGLCNCKDISPQEQTASEFFFFSMTCKFWLTSDFLSDKGN